MGTYRCAECGAELTEEAAVVDEILIVGDILCEGCYEDQLSPDVPPAPEYGYRTGECSCDLCFGIWGCD